VSLAVYRQEHLVELPMPPVSHSFMTDIDAAFVEHIFHIAKRQREMNAQHQRQANNFATRLK
jgi:hypothetical protein